jgi:hypothetical protein
VEPRRLAGKESDEAGSGDRRGCAEPTALHIKLAARGYQVLTAADVTIALRAAAHEGMVRIYGAQMSRPPPG